MTGRFMSRGCAARAGRRLVPQLTTTLALAAVVSSAGACSLVFDPELKDFAEYGDRCVANDECASGICHNGRCSQECSGSCPGDNAVCRSNVCRFLSPPPLDGPPWIGYLIREEPQAYGMAKTHDDGRAYVQEEFPQATTKATIGASTSSAPAAIDDLVSQGANIIVATSREYLNPMQNAAIRHPGVNFLLYSIYPGIDPTTNFGTYFGRMYQVMYMVGNLAARVSETGRIGIVGPIALPETVMNINAFTTGAREADPDVQVIVEWINDWSDAEAETEAAEALVNDGGADVIFGYTESTTPLTTAPAQTPTDPPHPVYVIGYGNENACEVDADRCLTSAYWNWGPMLTDLVQQMIDGAWEPDLIWDAIEGTPSQSVVFYSDINPRVVGLADIMEVEALKSDLIASSGLYLPFRGPLRDNITHEIRVGSGQHPDDDDLLTMCWFVEGIYQMGTGDPVPLEAARVPTSCQSW